MTNTEKLRGDDFEWRPDLDANFYHLFSYDAPDGPKWVAKIQFNGELPVHEQEYTLEQFLGALEVGVAPRPSHSSRAAVFSDSNELADALEYIADEPDFMEPGQAYYLKESAISLRSMYADFVAAEKQRDQLLDALVSLTAVAKKYLPGYDQQPEAPTVDAAIEVTRGGATDE